MSRNLLINGFLVAVTVLVAWPVNSIVAAPHEFPLVDDTFKHKDNVGSFRQPRMPGEITNTPLPVVVINGSLPVTIRNASLGLQVLNVPLPVEVAAGSVPIRIQGLPLPTVLVNNSLPVFVLNDSLNANVLNSPVPVNFPEPLRAVVENRPLPVTFNQPVNVFSFQLGSYLQGLVDKVSVLNGLLQSQYSRPVCPTDSDFGTNTTAPCRRISTQCYCFFNGIQYNRDEANNFCLASGFSGLVSLETKAEALAMADLLKLMGTQTGTVYYTSAIYIDGFYWMTVTMEQPFDDTQALWAAGEPSLGPTDGCVVINADGSWSDTTCSVQRNFICEVGVPSNAIDPYLPPIDQRT